MGVLTTFIEITIDGIGTGILWALLGAGITLVFGLGEVLNLAQGILAVLAAAVAFEVVLNGFGIWPALAAGIIALVVLSYVIDKLILSSVYRSEGEERILVAIFVTLGILLLLEGLVLGRHSGSFSLPGGLPGFQFYGLRIRGSDIQNIIVGLIVIPGLFAFLNYTYIGSAARTIASNEVGAHLCGVDVRQMRTIIFVLSGALAAIAGLMYAVGGSVSVGRAFQLTVFALIVSIVGGVRDVRGTIIAGVGLGIVYSYASYLATGYLAMVILFAAVMASVALKSEEML